VLIRFSTKACDLVTEKQWSFDNAIYEMRLLSSEQRSTHCSDHGLDFHVLTKGWNPALPKEAKPIARGLVPKLKVANPVVNPQGRLQAK
jgi:hypothetical protein